VYRSKKHPLPAGSVVKLTGGEVRVLSAQAGLPTAIELRLDVPLDDPSVTLMTWEDGALRPVKLDVGQSKHIVWSPGPTGLF
jgi:hypothetical protein